MGGAAATAAASSGAATAAGGAFSESRAGDPVVVDPFAVRGGCGFVASVSTGGAAGSATVVWAAARAAGGASLDFSTRVELCEKLSAALISEGGATTDGTLCTRDAICDLPEIRGGS